MKASSFITKETALLESLMSGTDKDTRRYLKNMHESFVVPYNAYLTKLSRRIDEAQLTADQITKLFGTIAGGPGQGGGTVLPDSIKQKFDAALPEPDAGPVQGFEQKAAQAAQQVQDPATKQGIMDLIKQGIQSPVTQKLILTGISGLAGVAASALTGGLGGALGAGAAGAITGGLMGVIGAKLQGADWKSAGMAGLKGAAMGGAAGAVGGLAGSLGHQAISALSGPQQDANQGPDSTDYQVKKGDTLSQIAKANGVSVNDIMAANAGQTKTTDLTAQGWNNDYHDAFTNLNPMGDFTGPTNHEYQVDQAPKIDNPDRLATGQNIRIPNATGNSTYQDGGGTAADTWNKTQTGAYKPDAITTNHAAAWGLDTGGQGDPSKTAGLAHDRWLAQQGGSSDTAVADAGSEQPYPSAGKVRPNLDAWRTATGSPNAPQAANLGPDFDPSKIPDGWTMKQGATPVAGPADQGVDLSTPTDYKQTDDAPLELTPKGSSKQQADWANGINPPPEWEKNSATGKYEPPSVSAPQGASMDPAYLQKVVNGEPGRHMITPDKAQAALDWQAQNGGQLQQAASTPTQGSGGYSKEYLQSVVDGTHPRPMVSVAKAKQLLGQSYVNPKPMLETVDRDMTVRMWALNESLGKPRGGVYITEAGIGNLISKIGNFIKGGAASKGKTAEQLQAAWEKAGSPLDSEQVAAFLKKQGIADDIIANAYKQVGIPAPGEKVEPAMGVEPGTPAEPAPAAAQAEPEQPAADQAQQGQQAQAGGDQAQAAQAAQQPTSTGTVFDNPEQLAKDFEEYMAAGGKISPQFRGAIKAALQTGFKVVESKQRKLLKVIKEARRIDAEIKKLKKQRL